MVTWERQHAEAPQVRLAQTELVEAVQARVVTERPNVVDRTPKPLDVIPQINPESISIEAEQEHVEDSASYSLESPTQLEDFDIEGLDFEPSEESLPIDDTYETSVMEEAEQGVETLLADLEVGMLQVEAEYMGKLLVGMFAGLTETEIIEDVEDVPDVLLTEAITLETEEDVSTIPEAPTSQGFEKEFSLYLESLEPNQAKATKDIIEDLSAAIKESQQLPEEAVIEEKEIIEQKIEELCIQLFESLGIEYDEETIKQFIQSIAIQELFIDVNIETNELSIEELNDLGTREYKPLDSASLLSGLVQFIKQKMQPQLILGRYALHHTAA